MNTLEKYGNNGSDREIHLQTNLNSHSKNVTIKSKQYQRYKAYSTTTQTDPEIFL